MVKKKQQRQPWYKPFTWLYIIIGAGTLLAAVAICRVVLGILSVFTDTPDFFDIPNMGLIIARTITPVFLIISAGVILFGTKLMKKRFKAGRLVIIGGTLQAILIAILFISLI